MIAHWEEHLLCTQMAGVSISLEPYMASHVPPALLSTEPGMTTKKKNKGTEYRGYIANNLFIKGKSEINKYSKDV